MHRSSRADVADHASDSNETARPRVLVVAEPHVAELAAEPLRHAHTLVGTVTKSAEASAVLRRAQVDFLVLDLELPDTCGLLAAAAARRDLITIAVTTFEDEASVFRALRFGAVGCVLKSEISSRLVASLREAAAGGAPMSPRVARYLVESFRVGVPSGDGDVCDCVTSREREVLELLAHGATYAEIGGMLGISENTVRTHVRSAYRKLDVTSKADATREALRRGVLRLR